MRVVVRVDDGLKRLHVFHTKGGKSHKFMWIVGVPFDEELFGIETEVNDDSEGSENKIQDRIKTRNGKQGICSEDAEFLPEMIIQKGSPSGPMGIKQAMKDGKNKTSGQNDHRAQPRIQRSGPVNQGCQYAEWMSCKLVRIINFRD